MKVLFGHLKEDQQNIVFPEVYTGTNCRNLSLSPKFK